MQTLRFPDARRLRQALEGGAVPASVHRAPSAAVTDEAGRVWLTTNAWLSKKSLLALGKLGVEIAETDSLPAALPLSCWHEAVPLADADLSADGPHLIDLPLVYLPAAVAELNRIQSTWSFRFQDGDRVLLQANRLSYHVILRWSDNSEIDGFSRAGDGVWVAWGRSHPLADRISPVKAKWLLISDRGWRWIDAEPWNEPVRSFPVSSAESKPQTDPMQSSIEVPLKLVPDRDSGAAELWVVRVLALAGLERFVREADSATISRFSVAVSRTSYGPLMALRAPAGMEFVPPFEAVPFRTLAKLPNLFIPTDRRLTPLPRRDILRDLLAPDPKRLHWLRPLEGTAFQVESLPLTAFRPLAEWIEYRVEQSPQNHTAWLGEDRFPFEPYVELADAVLKPRSPTTSMVPTAEKPEQPRRATRGWLTRQLDWLTGTIVRKEGPTPRSLTPAEDGASPSRAIDPPAKLSESTVNARRLEGKYLQRLGRLSANERRTMWPELAAAYVQANNASEAAVCWLGALWDEPTPSPTAALGWLKAEAFLAKWKVNAGSIVDWIAAPPEPARTRAVAAWVVWAANQPDPRRQLIEHLARVRAYLERNEEELPVRALWLAQSALAKLSQGDLLALARARDRLFDRLYLSGLSLDRDVPAFIRFAESGDPDRFNSVRQWLVDKRGLVRQWIAQLKPRDEDIGGAPLQEYGLEAEVPCTQAYADLMISWGLARLGDRNESARVRDQAVAKLDDADPVHASLKRLFDERIRQVREGRPASSATIAMPDLDALSVDDRYRVDRLRQHSRILDPEERINAHWTSHFRHFRQGNQLRQRLVELPMLEGDALQQQVAALLEQAKAAGREVLPLVLASVLETAPYLRPDLADRVLESLSPAIDQSAGTPEVHARLLERGMLAAATIDRPAVVQLLTRRFLEFIDAQQVSRLPHLLEGLTAQTFRCLRRLGLKAEADQVLSQVHARLTGGQDFPTLRQRLGNDWPAVLRTLLHIAAGWYFSGRDDDGHRIIDDARYDLYQGQAPARQRTGLALAYASALGQIPVRLALSRFEEMFQRLKRIGVSGWNTHYTLQPLQVVDTVVLATVNEDFTLGPAVRGWLDDEEHLVRSRIQSELTAMMQAQGMA